MKVVPQSYSRPMRVLVAVRDESARRHLVELIRDQGRSGEMALAEAESALAAFQSWRQEHADLILVATSELEPARSLAVRVRADEGPRHTGIIFIDDRALDAGTLSVECLENGADDFVRSDCPPAELMARLRAVLRLKAMTDELRSANHKLRVLSLTDELTGLANMRSFNQGFGAALRKCRQSNGSIAVMMLDLDHFKQVNDTTNHLVGSHVLAEIGRLLRQSALFQGEDVAARYGGDEFVAVFAAEDFDAAIARGEAVNRLIADAEFRRDDNRIQVTASIGVAWVPSGFTGKGEDLVKAADLMLYRSKREGRNRVSAMTLTNTELLNAALPRGQRQAAELLRGAARTPLRVAKA